MIVARSTFDSGGAAIPCNPVGDAPSNVLKGASVPAVRHNAANHRFELDVEGGHALAFFGPRWSRERNPKAETTPCFAEVTTAG